MFSFVDIHSHALFGVDDGATDEQEMQAMLRMAYADGTRHMCLTPHYAPDMFGEQGEAVLKAYARAEEYCRAHLPGMTLYLGNELNYREGCFEDLMDGKCYTVAGTRYVLVDFWMSVTSTDLVRGVSAISNSGYVPIVAHVERYECMNGKLKLIRELAEDGALIQVNSSSVEMGWMTRIGRMAGRLLAEGLVDIVASDGHRANVRPPILSAAYNKVRMKCNDPYAKLLFSDNPMRVLRGERVR